MIRRFSFRLAAQTGLLAGLLAVFVAVAGWHLPRVTATQDNTPPQITAFSMSPTSFTTESANQTLTLTVTLTDDQAGVCIPSDCGSFSGSATQVRYLPSSGSQFIDFTNFTRTSGDDKNGTYTATAVWPKGIKTGDWTISLFTLVDKLGNSVGLTSSQVLAAVPGATGVTVTNTAADEDSTAPNVTAFSLSPTSFSTESSDQTLTLTITLTDDQAGVCVSSDCGSFFSGGETQMRMMPSGSSQNINWTSFTRTSGTDKNGVYQATATFPVGIKKGNWSVTSLLLVDKLGNTRSLDASQILSAVPGATGTTVTNTATDDDTAPPQLTAFSISPTEINTENSDQTLTLNVTLTDDQSGVSSDTQLRLAPLIGTQTATFVNFTRTSGDAKNGTYTAQVTIPAHAKEGIWEVQNFLLEDKIGNIDTLDASKIASALPSASGETITNTATASSVTVDRDWTLSNANGSVTFPAGTVVTRKDGGSFGFYQMLAQSFNVNDLTSTDRLGTAVDTLRIGIPGLNLKFSQPVSVALNVGTKYNGDTLDIQSLGEGDASWANETTCKVSDGVCSFTVSHATYFLASIIKTASASTTTTPTTISLNGSTGFFDANGYATDLHVGDVLTFCLSGATTCTGIDQHTITVKGIDFVNGNVVLTFASTPFDVTFYVGAPQNIDVNQDGTPDLKVTLNSLTPNTVNFTFKSLVASAASATPQASSQSQTKPKKNYTWWWFIGVAAIVAGGYMLVHARTKQKLVVFDK